MQNGDETAEHHFGWSMSFSENAHNSSNALYSLIKFSIQYFIEWGRGWGGCVSLPRHWYAKR